MDNKKFNIFALLMIVFMAAFTIYTGINASKAKDGRNGQSTYERAVELGEFYGSEYEYLKSLHGKDGSDVTIEEVYNAYLSENGLTSSEMTLSEFIMKIYPDNILDIDETTSAAELATASALRSTVDICYSFYMNNPIIYVEEDIGSNQNKIYKIETSSDYYEKYTAIGVSAGSGVIYKIDNIGTSDINDDVAYIITNYHVLYADNFTNDEDNYRVFYNLSTNEYFTATYDENNVKSGIQNIYWGNQIIGTESYSYLENADVIEAPIETHFLDSYGVYVYGFQSSEYELSASFVGGSADNDIAVLKVERNKSENNERLFNGNYKAVDLGDSKKINEGETVIAVGNPLLADTSNINDKGNAQTFVDGLKQSYVNALCLTATSGEISAISEYTKFQSLLDPAAAVEMRLIRVSSAINAGNSGGGLYDIGGRLVAIVNGKYSSENYESIGFAIPINIAARLADRIIDECDGRNTRISAIKSTISSLGFSVENGNSDYRYDSSSGLWIRERNVIVKEVSASAVNFGIETGKIISAISFNNEETKYALTEYYDLNDVLLMAQKEKTTNIILHILETDKSITQIVIDVNDSMFEEII